MEIKTSNIGTKKTTDEVEETPNHSNFNPKSLLDHQLVVNQRKTPTTTTMMMNLVRRFLRLNFSKNLFFLSVSDTELENFQSFNTTNETDDLSDDRRRSSRATTQRNYAKDDDDSDEDYFENGRPPPRRMRYKKRRGSDDSFVDDDDDYEKIAQKRKIVKYGKSLHRSTITDRIRRLVDDDDEDEENENSAGDKIQSQGEMQVDEKQTNNQQESVENQKQQRPSDDDEDFPDEQEIFQANGLRKLQNSLVVPKPPALRPAFAGPMHSYQHAIIDPTARFAMIRPPIRPNGYPSNGHELTQQPSDSNQVNGHNSPTSSNFIIQDL